MGVFGLLVLLGLVFWMVWLVIQGIVGAAQSPPPPIVPSAPPLSEVPKVACLQTDGAVDSSVAVKLWPAYLHQFIGQENLKEKLALLIQAASERGNVLDHVLLYGPPGMGKRTLAAIIANELNVAFQLTSGPVIEDQGDLAAILSNVEKCQVLFIEDIHRLKSQIQEVLLPSLQDFHIDYLVGQGLGARTIKLNMHPFTLIGTVPNVTDCRPELVEAFPFVFPLERYSNSELEIIARCLAGIIGFNLLPPSVVISIVEASNGTPRRIELLFRRLAKMAGDRITEENAKRYLPLLGLDYQEVATRTQSANLEMLSGIGFEELIAQLLERMGFRAQTTKASGDGGVDIVATLDKAIIGGRYLIQCKRFAADSLIGSAVVREFYGALTADRKAVKGILITTSGFTAQAREFAEGLPLELIGGDQLGSLLSENGLGANAPQSALNLGVPNEPQVDVRAAWRTSYRNQRLGRRSLGQPQVPIERVGSLLGQESKNEVPPKVPLSNPPASGGMPWLQEKLACRWCGTVWLAPNFYPGETRCPSCGGVSVERPEL